MKTNTGYYLKKSRSKTVHHGGSDRLRKVLVRIGHLFAFVCNLPALYIDLLYSLHSQYRKRNPHDTVNALYLNVVED